MNKELMGMPKEGVGKYAYLELPSVADALLWIETYVKITTSGMSA